MIPIKSSTSKKSVGALINYIVTLKILITTTLEFLPKDDIFTDRVRSTRREVIFSLCQSTPGMGGYPSQVSDRGTLSAGQQMEYLVCRGRYASCVHARGLSCALIICPQDADPNPITALGEKT